MEASIKDQLDLWEETFIQPGELKNYFNEGVAMLQSQIHTLAEDYFLAHAIIPVTVGDEHIQLPANIYGNKLRKVIWDYDQNERYEVYPIRDIMSIPYIQEQDFYQYMFVNNGVTVTDTIGTVINMYPKLRATSDTALKIWYIRGVSKYEDENSVCDIPEWSNIIIQYVRYKCMIKEGHPQSAQAKQDLQELIVALNESLRSRTMDENTKLSQDPRTFADYSDFTSNDWYGWNF